MSSGKRRNPLGLSLPPTVNENSESGDGVAVCSLTFHFIFYKSPFFSKVSTWNANFIMIFALPYKNLEILNFLPKRINVPWIHLRILSIEKVFVWHLQIFRTKHPAKRLSRISWRNSVWLSRRSSDSTSGCRSRRAFRSNNFEYFIF